MIETSIAVLLTGLLLVAALRSVGAAKRREAGTSDQVRGQQLAADLMNEILRQSYEEPDDAAIFGPETGEATGNRTLFDDVDDYIGWTSSPPKDRNGAAVSGFSGWTRSANVIWADPATLGTTTKADTGLKKISVTVSRPNGVTSTLVSYRSVAWVDTIPDPSSNLSNHPPVAVATGSPLSGRVPLTPTFIATSSTDQDSDALTFVWDFGDGQTGAGSTASHKYSAVGTYSCKLTVYDGQGGVGTAVLSVSVTP